MTNTTEIKKSRPDKILTSLNPHSSHFNFELWAQEVRQQMQTALQKPLRSRRT